MFTVINDIQWEYDENKDRYVSYVGKMKIEIPSDYKLPSPIFCPICIRCMRGMYDHISYDKNKCCNFCETYFLKPNQEKWESGWRPSHDEVSKLISEKYIDNTNDVFI